jgi:hypothetical protein
MKVKKKRCKECSNLFIPYNSLQIVCGVDCAIKYNKSKAKADKEKIDKLYKEKKERLSLATVLGYTKTRVHQYIRKRDEGKPCISCNAPYKSDFDAGHFYPAGKFTALKFDLNNIHGQCIQCNRYKEGNFEMYSLSLPNRIGIQAYQKLVKRAETSIKHVKKWNREELKQIQKHIKEL